MRAIARRICACICVLALGGCSSSSGKTDGAVDHGPTLDTRRDGPALKPDGAADARPDALRPDTKPKLPARWDKAADLAQPRKHHTATLLQDGSVLVVGGAAYNTSPSTEVLKSVERYDPKTNIWTTAAPLTTGRHGHAALLLKDGRVLVVGGCKTYGSLGCSDPAGAEIFDPKDPGAWKPTSAPLALRYMQGTTLLLDGRPLVAGGYNNQNNFISIEIFDPATGFWMSPAASLSSPRNMATATTLTNGKVIVAGGWDSPAQLPRDTIDLFDPATGAITVLATKLKEARLGHTATVLGDGRVLFVGGECDSPQNPTCLVIGADVYDPQQDKVLTVGSPASHVIEHSATLLPDGRVLVVGGYFTQDLTRIYDPVMSAWVQTATMTEKRWQHTATLLPDGRVLVAGGESTSTPTKALAAVEIYTP